MTKERSRLEELVAATPDTRDRYVDFLRAASIVAVVVGHWFIGMIYWRDGVIGTTSAIGITSWLWFATWFLQVIPIFFFVGGYSNFVTYRAFRRRGQSTGEYLRSRMVRLLKPTLVFVGVWIVIEIGLHIADVGGDGLFRLVRPPAATVPFGPLWFLAVYILIVLVSPLMIRLHERFGVAVPTAMVIGAIVADLVGFGLGLSPARWFNVALVWLLPHQIGFFYGDGRLSALPRRALVAMAAVGFAALIFLTNLTWFFGDAFRSWFPGIGSYPKSLLGTDVEQISNMQPPTLCLVAMTLWSIGAVMLLRPYLSRWLQRARVWKIVILGNSVVMTLFLWHMTAYLIAILLLWPTLGLGQETDSTPRWWLERPTWELVPAVILVVLIAIFGRFERPASRPRASTAPS